MCRGGDRLSRLTPGLRNGQGRYAGIGVFIEIFRVVQILHRHFGHIETPEQPAIDSECRHTEHTACDRLIGVLPQFLLNVMANDIFFGFLKAGDP